MKTLLLFILLAIANCIYTFAQCQFKAIGHRGGSSLYFPENTLYSLKQGFMEDIYAAEVDVRYTSDSVLVLMHDYRIDRTTNGIGEISQISYADIQKLDAGSWKGKQFKGEKVPTLAEAIKLAYDYNKKLYLNMKIYNPDLIKNVLKNTGIPDSVIILDPDDLDKVIEYHTILPKVPLVYFGEIPTDINDEAFYSTLKNNGVIAVEVPSDIIVSQKDKLKLYKEKLHENKIEFWTYTVNDNAFMKVLNEFGIDALETDRPTESRSVFCDNKKGGFYPQKAITGEWNFENSLSATIGSQLVVMSNNGPSIPEIKFGKTSSFSLPLIENKDVNIAKIPSLSADYSLRFFSNIAPDGPPSIQDCDNTYTLLFDLLKPSSSADYISIYQTSNDNSDDGDMFIYSPNNSIGVLGDYHGNIQNNKWFRLALIFDLTKNKIDKYIDGELVGTNEIANGINGRFCINNNWGVQSSNFFSDNDGETSDMYVSSIQLRNYPMSAAEIKYLGTAKATKISDSIFNNLALIPIFTQQPKDSSIFVNANSKFTVNASDSCNYRWQMNKGKGWELVQGVEFSGVASSTLNIKKAGIEWNGTKFRCIASRDLSAYSKEAILNVKVDDTAIKNDEAYNIGIYPNPTSGNVIIDLGYTISNCSICIYNIQGVKIIEKENIKNKEEIFINNKTGNYIVQIKTSNGVYYKKLTVK